jgi:hypothetical protein
MPELARLAGGDLVTSHLLVASAWVGEPGFGGCEVLSRARNGAAPLFGRLVTRVGWLWAVAGWIACGCGGFGLTSATWLVVFGASIERLAVVRRPPRSRRGPRSDT